MSGADTIIIMLRCHFQIPDIRIHRLNDICNFFINGLEDPDHEKRLCFEDLNTKINVLAIVFSSHNQLKLATIQNDLWTLLCNWWNTATWARREVRIPLEHGDLIGDLLRHIVVEITHHFGNNGMRQHYNVVVLKALIELSTLGRIRNPYLRQRVRQYGLTQDNMDNLLIYYRQLSVTHGFMNRTHVLLQLLLDKKARNANRHTDNKVREYGQYCIGSNIEPSFSGYIGFRRLNIDEQFFDDYERLFLVIYARINNDDVD